MHFPAVSLGEAVPGESFEAVIRSVFDSAVNLRLAHEDRLITVLLSDHYELPQGIRIAAKDTPLHSLVLGQRAAARGGVLRFDSFPLTIDLRGAPVWRCPVRELHTDMSADSTQAAWSRVWKLLNQGQRLRSTEIIADDLFRSKTGSPLSQKMSGPVTQLIASTEQFDLETAIQAAQEIVGLGPGVTPSGDDLLIGFLTALWSLARENHPQVSFIDSFGSALMRIAARTNEISRTYLYHATRGQFSSSLSNLAQAIARNSAVEQATQLAMRVGHSSGMDSVTGLLIGLCVWNKKYPLRHVP
jgi:hypothetical protein